MQHMENQNAVILCIQGTANTALPEKWPSKWCMCVCVDCQ